MCLHSLRVLCIKKSVCVCVRLCVCVCVRAAVSYIPEKVVARPGENVTVYCVFNDHNINASTAMWMLNFQQRLHHSQYHPVNQWVRKTSASGNISTKGN